MDKIVLTGATSMLGIALIKECIKNNVEVLAISRPNSKNLNRLPGSNLVTSIECDLKDLNTVSKFSYEGYNVFYHFGWEGTSKDTRDNPEIQNGNILNTLEAVKLAKAMGCGTFIGAGSQAEYGLTQYKISPDTSVNPISSYGVAKYSAYKLSSILCRQIGIKHIWARVFSVYGPNDNNETMISYCIKKLLNNEKPSFTKSEQLWDFMYCDDAARAFKLLGEKGKNQSIYCIGSGDVRPLYKYIIDIRNLIDRDLPIGIGELDYVENQVMHLYADISSLTKDTGFTPTFSFIEGINNTIKWVKENKC